MIQPTGGPAVTVTPFLTAQTAAQVRALLGSAEQTDAVAAVSEQFTLRLDDRDDTGRAWHATAWIDDQLVGYGVAERGESPSAELVVDPTRRRSGVGTALLAALIAAGAGPLRVWAHGDLPAARAFLTSLGARESRLLLELRRPRATVEVPSVPAEVTVRTFVPGQDDAAWLALNAESFAHHPEQGAWNQRDLDERKAEPWFDPRGFFLAERDGELLAFHWTKLHSPELGEVYVVGVSPKAQGLGLGRLMTATGLAHLQNRGVRDISLYVDGDNTTAVALYQSLGFTEEHRDSQWVTA